MSNTLAFTYKQAAFRRAGAFRILGPGLLASALLHVGAAGALLLLARTPSRVAGAPTVTVSLIDSIETSARKTPTIRKTEQRSVTEMTATAPAQALPSSDEVDKEDSQDSTAALAANMQGKPAEMEPLREAQFSADYLHNPKPQYPALSRRLGEQGRVLLQVQVSTEGLPLQVVLKESSGFARLDQAAVDVVQKWNFVAAKRGTFTQVSWVDVPLMFVLQKQ